MHFPHVQVFVVTAVSYFRVSEVTYFTSVQKYQNGCVQFIQTGAFSGPKHTRKASLVPVRALFSFG